MRAASALLAAVAVCALALVLACTTTITPPDAVREPVDVFVIDHGRHASLALATGDRAVVRYAYGDWEWYALSHETVGNGFAALIGPTSAALGRGRIEGVPLTPAGVKVGVREGAQSVLQLQVEASRAAALRSTLDAVFRDSAEPPVYNATYDLEFVRHPDAYSLMHNSNHVVAGWLEALGCGISGPTVLSRWRIEGR